MAIIWLPRLSTSGRYPNMAIIWLPRLSTSGRYSLPEALAKHVLQSTGGGAYLHERLLHCDLLKAEGSDEVTVAVLTAARLLTVDKSSWKLSLNMQLRKVESVSVSGSALLVSASAATARSLPS